MPGNANCRSTDGSLPSWDAQRRVLQLGNELVKLFRVPAPNQEAVLSAFEEEGWPFRVDDPLPLSRNKTPSAVCTSRFGT